MDLFNVLYMPAVLNCSFLVSQTISKLKDHKHLSRPFPQGNENWKVTFFFLMSTETGGQLGMI